MQEDWAEADKELDAFRVFVDSQTNRDFRDTAVTPAPQSTIYHYTDVKSALAILQRGQLWFTERAHLNDPVEIRYGLDIGHRLFEIAANDRGSAIPRGAAAHLRGEHYFGLATYGFWIASFSLNGDDLSQWRSYANDGRGVCLGFSANHIDEYSKSIPGNSSYLIAPVNYDGSALCRRMKTYIDRGLDLLEKVNLAARESYDKPYGRALLYERDFFRILNDGFYINSFLSNLDFSNM